MKKITSKIIAILTLMLLVLTGCTKDIDDVDTIKFQNTPQSTYYQVSQDKIEAAIEQLYNEIVIEINGNPWVLKDALDFDLVKVSGLELNKVGTHTLVIRYRKTTLTYVYRIVSSDDLFAEGFGTAVEPYIITTPEHFINIGTKVLGVPRPSPTADEDAWKAYFSLCFPYLSNDMHFTITSDLDFDDVEYTTMGVLGDKHYVPFRGTIIGDKGDGAAPVISNLVINSASSTNENTALFAGATKTRIENLKFVAPRVVADPSAEKAALLWSAPGVVDSDNINVVKNVEVTNGFYQAQRSGGLVLEATNTIFVNCSVKNSTLIGLSAHTGGIGAFASLPGRNYSYKDATSSQDATSLITIEKINIESGKNYDSTDVVAVAFVDCSIEGTKIYVKGTSQAGNFTSSERATNCSINGVKIPANSANPVDQLNIMQVKTPTELYQLSEIGSTYEYFITFSVNEDGISSIFTISGSREDFYENNELKGMSLKYVNGREQPLVDESFQVDNKYERLNVDGSVAETFYFTPKLDDTNKVELYLVVIETKADGSQQYYTHAKGLYKVPLLP